MSMSTSENQTRILCYGHDELLLLTRKHILEMHGISVSTVSTAPEFHAEICSAQPAVILLCQSLSTEECTCAAAFAEANSPSSKVLQMYTVSGESLRNRKHVEFYSGNGPAALVETVKQLLSPAQRYQDLTVSSLRISPQHSPNCPVTDRTRMPGGGKLVS